MSVQNKCQPWKSFTFLFKTWLSLKENYQKTLNPLKSLMIKKLFLSSKQIEINIIHHSLKPFLHTASEIMFINVPQLKKSNENAKLLRN